MDRKRLSVLSYRKKSKESSRTLFQRLEKLKIFSYVAFNCDLGDRLINGKLKDMFCLYVGVLIIFVERSAIS